VRMERVMSNEEDNAASQPAIEKAVGASVIVKGRQYSPFVFGKASSISKQQARDVAQLHESFTYNLKNRLSATLQAATEVVPASVDEFPYSDFVRKLPEDSYLALIDVQPAHALAVLGLELSVARVMIDLMLGGDGRPAPAQRPLTEIEEKVLQIALDVICEELVAAWRQVIEIDFSFDRSRRLADLYRLIPSYEKILILCFDLKVAAHTGTLTLAFPAAVSSALVRKLVRKSSRTQSQLPEFQARIRERLLDCVFGVQLVLPPTRIKGRDLLLLTTGQTLLIQHTLSQPAVLLVAGRRMFSAVPARSGTQRCAAVRQKFPISFSDEKVSG